MVYEISIQEFKAIFLKTYGINFIDGFHLFQSPFNVVQYGYFKLYDNYADEDIYIEIPILRELFQEETQIYIYTDHAYSKSNIFVLKAKEIKNFIKNFSMDFFSNEPLFINFYTDTAFGYCLEGANLDTGIFFEFNLKQLRKANRKFQIKTFIDILSNDLYGKK